ncbi:hypothetical protein B0H13DRAFT_1919068 [Mycena leptocephala]|nr:hypothetical protein B0H13DRAFT_1919068 [Mycena leptocephala]
MPEPEVGQTTAGERCGVQGRGRKHTSGSDIDPGTTSETRVRKPAVTERGYRIKQGRVPSAPIAGGARTYHIHYGGGSVQEQGQRGAMEDWCVALRAQRSREIARSRHRERRETGRDERRGGESLDVALQMVIFVRESVGSEPVRTKSVSAAHAQEGYSADVRLPGEKCRRPGLSHLVPVRVWHLLLPAICEKFSNDPLFPSEGEQASISHSLCNAATNQSPRTVFQLAPNLH